MNKNSCKYILFSVCFMCLMIFSGCNVTQFLNEDQIYLKNETVELKGNFKSNEKTLLKENLIALTNIKPFKREAIYTYYKNQGKIDSAKAIRRTFYQMISKEPVFFDTVFIESIKNSMTNFLQKEGYFDAKVTYETSIKKGKFGSVKYIAEPKSQYTFRDITYEVREPELAVFLSPFWEMSFIKRGEVVSDLNYQKEKLRVTELMLNNGFYYFDPSLVGPLVADSIGLEVNAAFRINETDDRKVVQRYKIGRVNIHSDFDPNYNKLYNLDTMVNNYRFLQINKDFKVKPSTILQYVYLKNGDYYSKENFSRTYRQLNRLGLFRYINVNQVIDDGDTTLLNVDIYLPPAKTMDVSYDIDLNYANLRTSTTKLFSVAVQAGTSIVKRNLFNGGESLRSNLSVGYETSFNSLVNRVDFRFQNSLSVPRFLDFLGIISTMKKIPTKNGRLLSEKFISTLDDRVTTNISADFEFVNFTNWYRYYNLNGSYGFDVIQDNEHHYKWNHVGINYFKPFVFSNYQEVLEKNLFLKQSFENPRLFTGLLLRDLTYTYKSVDDLYGQNQRLAAYFEVSGAEVSLANKIFSKDKEWKLFNTVEFSKFAKFYAEASQTKRLFNNIMAAAKFGIGAAYPFGSSKSVPYLKQFEIGGPFSLRAFPIRKIGPGSYQDPVQLENFENGPYYQTGDLKIEFLSEIRFPLFYIFKGALFLDAGNIWSLTSDNDVNPGSRFNFNDQPWTQIAIGSGLGLRADLEFFVFRLDVGTILKNPYKDKITGTYDPYFNFNNRLGRLEYNLALNYPF